MYIWGVDSKPHNEKLQQIPCLWFPTTKVFGLVSVWCQTTNLRVGFFIMNYVKLTREIIEHPVFVHQVALKIWIWCLLRASYKDRAVSFKVSRGDTLVKIKAGQFIFGRFKAEEELGIDGSSIYRWIQKFSTKEWDLIKIEPNNQYSIITICNWDKYQQIQPSNEQPMNNQRTTDEQPMNTNKNSITSKECIWRKNFDEYLINCKKGFTTISKDNEFMQKLSELNPGIDVMKSIEKSFIAYWGTEEGWNNKKKSKSKTIDWKATLMKTIQMNVVKLTR